MKQALVPRCKPRDPTCDGEGSGLERKHSCRDELSAPWQHAADG
jgi:hypothetical protein